jgi:transcriptional regulator with XRE-family HTH domain
MNFYDKFMSLCKQKGAKASPVCEAIGLNRSAASRWKNGGVPDGATILKICKYFDVPVSYFYEDEPPPAEAEKNDAPAAEKGDEYAEVIDLLTELRERSEMRMLFKLAKGATREDVEQAVKIIEALRK